MSPLDRLAALARNGGIRDLDLHFAGLMARLSTGDEALILAAALASVETGAGNVCTNLARWAGRSPFEADPELVMPEFGSWTAALEASPVVGGPGAYRPLILDGTGRLYLYRYWRYERQVADGILARAGVLPLGADDTGLEDALAALFPGGPEEEGQREAARVAAARGLCVISGGPGTGKTTAVTRILALLQSLAGGTLRVALAAPTGKAAVRMQQALGEARQRLPASLGEGVPERASTLHRLLGARPGSSLFRHQRDNPLAVDVLVVDEVSMVDMALLAKTLDALPADARLILVGDRDQLASVEAGAVLGDLCAGVDGTAGKSGLAGSIALLQHNFRFAADSGIDRLAERTRRGDPEGAVAVLSAGETRDLEWHTPGTPASFYAGLRERAGSGFADYLERIREGGPPAEVLAALDGYRVLTALRRGPYGVEEINRMIEQGLTEMGLIPRTRPWYPGRPVMVTRNDHGLRLYNGDIGVSLPDPEEAGRQWVFFNTPEGDVRRVAPARLPPHETCYAMTVHKSQGSEFREVLLVLPPEPGPVMTRELIYTAITRARRRACLWASERVLREALTRPVERASGLREALWGSGSGGLQA